VNPATVMLSASVAKHLISEEDQARANWYAWFASVWLSAPSQLAIDGWASTVESAPTTDLAQRWSETAVAAARLGAAAISKEFDLLFISVGKPEVFSFASYHLTGFLHEKPLVDIRQRFNELDLGRFDLAITEDHVGLLCTAMRELVLRTDGGQEGFFRDFLASWCDDFCTAIEVSPRADFYKTVAALWQCFVAIEQQSFDFE
jgi:TorA maturation chaperone TorD